MWYSLNIYSIFSKYHIILYLLMYFTRICLYILADLLCKCLCKLQHAWGRFKPVTERKDGSGDLHKQHPCQASVMCWIAARELAGLSSPCSPKDSWSANSITRLYDLCVRGDGKAGERKSYCERTRNVGFLAISCFPYRNWFFFSGT